MEVTKRYRCLKPRVSWLLLPTLVLVWIGIAMWLGDSEPLRLWLMQADNLYLMAGAITVLIILSAMVPLPGEVLAIANGMIFGAVLGTAMTWAAALLGAFLAFYWSHRLRYEFNIKGDNRIKIDKINVWLNKWGVIGFLLARLTPTIPFFAVNIAAAFLPIKKRTFIIITGIAIIPYALIFNYLGAELAGY